jgi:hypothetical protein
MKTAMLLILLTTLVSCLSSCRSVPNPNRELIVEQCGLTFAILINGDIDLKASKCECRQYEYSLSRLGAIAGTTIKHPVEYCQKLIGNKPKEYLKLVNFLGDVRQDILVNLGAKK